MGETAVYPRELKERRESEGKAPFRDHSRVRMKEGRPPLHRMAAGPY